MAEGIITTLMSDDWGREESAVNQNKKRKTGEKEREKERKKQRKRLHIGRRPLKSPSVVVWSTTACTVWAHGYGNSAKLSQTHTSTNLGFENSRTWVIVTVVRSHCALEPHRVMCSTKLLNQTRLQKSWGFFQNTVKPKICDSLFKLTCKYSYWKTELDTTHSKWIVQIVSLSLWLLRGVIIMQRVVKACNKYIQTEDETGKSKAHAHTHTWNHQI